jgi:hypothetical protein
MPRILFVFNAYADFATTLEFAQSHSLDCIDFNFIGLDCIALYDLNEVSFVYFYFMISGINPHGIYVLFNHV